MSILPTDGILPRTKSGGTPAAASITYAQIQNVSATQRVLARDTAGAGVVEEVTAGQLFDWVSTTNGVLLTRTGADTWAAAAKAAIDTDGDLLITENATPTTPAAGKVKVFATSLAARSMPAFLSSVGIRTAVQPFMGQRKVGFWQAQGGTVVSSHGMAAATVGGTATARTPASTNLATSSRRIGAVSAAGAGSVAQWTPAGNVSQFWRGNAAGLGGFHAVFRWNNSDAALVNTARTFVGFMPGAVTGDAEPSTFVNCFGVGNNNGDTNLQLYASGAVAQTRVDLGASFPAQTTDTDLYELVLFAEPNGSGISMTLTRLNTGAVYATTTVTTAANLFSNTTFVAPKYYRSNGGTGSAVGIDLVHCYVETVT